MCNNMYSVAVAAFVTREYQYHCVHLSCAFSSILKYIGLLFLLFGAYSQRSQRLLHQSEQIL